MTKMHFQPITKWPYGYEIADSETCRRIVAQDSAWCSTTQKSHWDNINGIGMGKASREAAEQVEKQNLNAIQMAASGHLLEACQAALRIVELWRYPDNVAPEHEGEAQAVAAMEQKLRQAVELATTLPECVLPEFRKVST